jgi:hypothetical protein
MVTSNICPANAYEINHLYRNVSRFIIVVNIILVFLYDNQLRTPEWNVFHSWIQKTLNRSTRNVSYNFHESATSPRFSSDWFNLYQKVFGSLSLLFKLSDDPSWKDPWASLPISFDFYCLTVNEPKSVLVPTIQSYWMIDLG